MRAWLRDKCDDVWVIDCTPEGHQPGVSTRIFQGVQQPVCIVLASCSSKCDKEVPASVRFRALPEGNRMNKFDALKGISMYDAGWAKCPNKRYAPFLPEAIGAWATFPKLENLFAYNGSGCQPKRTWIIAPDADSLRKRWDALVVAPVDSKELLFHPTLRGGVPADRHSNTVLNEPLPGFDHHLTTLSKETKKSIDPVRYAYRSFDRQ